MLDFTNIGMALRLLRRRRNLKQSTVAEGARITSPMLSAYETGKQKPSFTSIDKILGALGYDAVDLASALETVANGKAEEDGERRAQEIRIQRLVPEDLGTEERMLMARLLPALLCLLRHLKG